MVIRVLGILFTCVPLFFLAGCARKEEPAVSFETHPVYKNYSFSNDEKVVEIGVPAPWASVNHIVEVMKRDLIFRKQLGEAGYEVRFYPFLKGADINFFIKKGLLEGAITGDMPALIAASEDLITVESVFSRVSVSLISRDIYRVRDLKNRKVAYPYGAISHYYLLKLLDENGMTRGDIRHVPMDTKDMLEGMKAGRIDAFSTFEPTATIYTKIDPTLHTMSRSFSSYAFFSVRKDYGERHNDVVRMIIEAQARAVIWINESDRNLDRASSWVARESLKVSAIPLDSYIRELNKVAREDLAVNTRTNAVVLSGEMTRDGGILYREFEFLKTNGFIRQGRQWKEVVRNLDPSNALYVVEEMKATPASIRE